MTKQKGKVKTDEASSLEKNPDASSSSGELIVHTPSTTTTNKQPASDDIQDKMNDDDVIAYLRRRDPEYVNRIMERVTPIKPTKIQHFKQEFNTVPEAQKKTDDLNQDEENSHHEYPYKSTTRREKEAMEHIREWERQQKANKSFTSPHLSGVDLDDGYGFRPTSENFHPRENDVFANDNIPHDIHSRSNPTTRYVPNTTYQNDQTSGHYFQQPNTTYQPPHSQPSYGNTGATTNQHSSQHFTQPTSTYQPPHFQPSYGNPGATNNQNGSQYFQHNSTHATQHTNNVHNYASGQNHNTGNNSSQTRTNQHNLSTGLSLRPIARPEEQATYEYDRVIISRFRRGQTEKERAKSRELSTEAITPTITRSNITKVLNSDSNLTSYDIAEDASQWQTSLMNINRHAVAYDFKPIFMIPLYFDENDVHSIDSNTHFVNSILDHSQLEDHHYFRFQAFLRRFGKGEELTSDAWMEEKLRKSLTPSLLAEVSSDFDELPQI